MSKESKRYTIDLSSGARGHLSALAKRFKLTQGEVIEVLLSLTRDLEPDTWIAIQLAARREQKLTARKAVARLKNLPADQLAVILDQVDK